MVKVTLERIECDICGEEGSRYTVNYPEGTKTLDRCQKHASKILALKEEKGEWNAAGDGRGYSYFEVSTMDDIRRQREAIKNTKKD